MSPLRRLERVCLLSLDTRLTMAVGHVWLAISLARIPV